MKNEFFPMNLQLFADGGAAAGGDGGAEGTGVTAAAAVPQGVTASPPEVQKQPEKPVDRHAEFESMIKGDYKEAYDKRVQDTIQKRLRGQKETVDKYNAAVPLLEMMADKYGKDVSDIAGLIKAIEADESFFESAAMERGMEVKDYKVVRTLERENARLKAESTARADQEQRNQMYSLWEQQANEAKKLYPGLDMNQESQNPQFRQLLMAGVDVGTAYMVIHKDDVMAGAMKHAADTIEKKLSNQIQSGGKRPSENGASGQSAAVTKVDPSKMSREDRRKMIERAARGERIEF